MLLAGRTVLSGNQPQIAGHLLAPLEPGHIAQGQHIRQGSNGTNPRLGHQQTRFFIFLGCLFHRLVQHHDLLVHRFEQCQQVLPSDSRPQVQRHLQQLLLAFFTPQRPALLHALVQGQVLQFVLHPDS